MNRAEYADYERRFAEGTAGLTFTSSGAACGCEQCGLAADASDDERELAGEPSFSSRPCEFCNRPLGGDREPAHAYIRREDGREELLHFSICVDCVYYLEYGRLDDATMMEIDRE